MKAWELLEDPKKWTTGAYARLEDGQTCSSYNPAATCWCTLGAIRKCYPHEQLSSVLTTLSNHVRFIPEWNDASDHATVLAKLKELDI